MCIRDRFDPKEREIVASENARLLELGVIELEDAVHTPDEFISTIFVRKRKAANTALI